MQSKGTIVVLTVLQAVSAKRRLVPERHILAEGWSEGHYSLAAAASTTFVSMVDNVNQGMNNSFDPEGKSEDQVRDIHDTGSWQNNLS